MKQLSAFLIFILLSANSFSQDYKTIRPERIVHFESLNNSKTIASIRIDSIYQYGDT